MSDTLLLRTRPTTVEARRITEDTRNAIIEWINQDGNAWAYGTRGVTWHDAEDGGIHDAFLGDWIIRSAWGEFRKISDSALFSRYESLIAAVTE